jgi:DNA-directed RNA polymerase specialized sigma24 family protein
MQTDLPQRAAPASAPPNGQELEAAFRDLHGTRLHGFALLLTLGDRATAARLSERALGAARGRLAELRHPERAAAWLRARVLRDTPRALGRRPGPAPDREAALAELGVDQAVLAGLQRLGTRERAAVIASTVERLDARDVATVVGRDGPRLDRLLRSARSRYLAVHAAAAAGRAMGANGPIGEHLDAVAAQAMR